MDVEKISSSGESAAVYPPRGLPRPQKVQIRLYSQCTGEGDLRRAVAPKKIDRFDDSFFVHFMHFKFTADVM
jgi:hypothetical protein